MCAGRRFPGKHALLLMSWAVLRLRVGRLRGSPFPRVSGIRRSDPPDRHAPISTAEGRHVHSHATPRSRVAPHQQSLAGRPSSAFGRRRCAGQGIGGVPTNDPGPCSLPGNGWPLRCRVGPLRLVGFPPEIHLPRRVLPPVHPVAKESRGVGDRRTAERNVDRFPCPGLRAVRGLRRCTLKVPNPLSSMPLPPPWQRDGEGVARPRSRPERGASRGSKGGQEPPLARAQCPTLRSRTAVR